MTTLSILGVLWIVVIVVFVVAWNFFHDSNDYWDDSEE